MSEYTFINNVNIDFFSWDATICIVYVCGRFARDVTKRRREARVTDDDTGNTYAPETNLWYLLAVTALVILVNSVELYQAFDCSVDANADLCMRTRYAFSLGAITTAIEFSCAVCATIGNLNLNVEVGVAIVLFCLHMPLDWEPSSRCNSQLA
jgi:hypothetical protein